MGERVLVAYATKHGSTAQIADTIAGALRNAGHEVDVQPVRSVASLSPYRAVVVGSAIYDGRWRDDAEDFLERLAPDLRARDVWLFDSGPLGPYGLHGIDAPKSVVRAADRVGARGHASFGGRLAEDAEGFMEPWMPKGDWRDFDEINRWADGVAAAISLNGRQAADTRQPLRAADQPA